MEKCSVVQQEAWRKFGNSSVKVSSFSKHGRRPGSWRPGPSNCSGHWVRNRSLRTGAEGPDNEWAYDDRPGQAPAGGAGVSPAIRPARDQLAGETPALP